MVGPGMNNPLVGRRVLVVEDEVLVSWVLEDILADLGCQVVGPAARVNQALAMVDSEVIDLAILDINLNGQNSFPVADALVARGVPFVFSTGYNNDGFGDVYKRYPMMQKPYSQADLIVALERALATKQPHENAH